MGGRAAGAAFYSPQLVGEILRGMRDTEDHEAAKDNPDLEDPNAQSAMLVAGSLHDVPIAPVLATVQQEDLASKNKHHVTTFKMSDGSSKKINLQHSMKPVYLDEYTRAALPHQQLVEAMYDELDYFNEHVWRGIPLAQAQKDPTAKIICTRWVLSNKGDASEPDVRARLVAQEISLHHDESFYAATPPLEAKRLLLSQFASERTRDGAPLKLSFIDVRKAYFNGRPSRRLFVRLPAEMGLPKDTVARLDRCMYGTRDAGAIWETCYTEALLRMGFTQGAASPCCFYHKAWRVQVVVPGDDFTALGTQAGLDLYEQHMKASFEVKIKGRISDGPGDCQYMRVLNRIIRYTKSGLLYEPDPRHVELLIRDLGLQDATFRVTPGNKPELDDITNPTDLVDMENMIATLQQTLTIPNRKHMYDSRRRFNTTTSLRTLTTINVIHVTLFLLVLSARTWQRE